MKMRITFVLPDANMGGGTRVIAIYADRLHRRGHRVSVVATPAPVPTMVNRVKSLVKGYGWPRRVRRIGPSYFDKLPHLDFRRVERFRPIADADVPDADVVVATYWLTGMWVNALSPARGAKAIFLQGYEQLPSEPNPRMDAVWRMPMHKIVISRWLVDLARTKFHDADVSHVPNSVDTGQFNAPPRGKQATPTVGMLYHDDRLKGADVAIAAFNRAAERVPGLKLVAFGQPTDRTNPPLPASAEYTQNPRQDAIKDLYARCDAWLCGSRCEGFHLPPLEAMACRCPVVSTRVGGPLDVVEEGVNGHLVPVEDVEALAERLVRVVTLDEAKWRAMSDAAHRTATRYTWDDATDLFEAALQRAADGSRSGRPLAVAG